MGDIYEECLVVIFVAEQGHLGLRITRPIWEAIPCGNPRLYRVEVGGEGGVCCSETTVRSPIRIAFAMSMYSSARAPKLREVCADASLAR